MDLKMQTTYTGVNFPSVIGKISNRKLNKNCRMHFIDS